MRRLRCRGVASIEFALVLFAGALMLQGCLFYGRALMYTLALDRSVHDMARYLTQQPEETLRNGTRRAVVLNKARAMLQESLQQSGLQLETLYVEMRCGGFDCDRPGIPLDHMSVYAHLTYHATSNPDFDTNLSAYEVISRDN